MILKHIGLFSFLVAIAAATINSSTETLKLMKKFDNQFEVDTRNNVVLFLGPSKSGKSTLKLLLSGAPLVSKETSPGSAQYVFHDFNGKIGSSTTESSTVIPEPVFDPELNTSYYEISGFEDSRPEYELPLAYLTRKLLLNAKSLKIVLVVNKSNVMMGEQRSTFLKLMEYVINLLKDIDRFKDSIAMVATKADSIFYAYEDTLEDDEALIQDVQNYLLDERDEIVAKLENSILSEDDRKLNEEKVKLLNILSKRNRNAANGFERIGIFRRAMEEGSLEKMPEIQKNKKEIKIMIIQNLKFYKNDGKNDIGYVVSSKAVYEMNELIDKIVENQLKKDIWDVCQQMKNGDLNVFEKFTDYRNKPYVNFLLNMRCVTLPTVKAENKPLPLIDDTEDVDKKESEQPEFVTAKLTRKSITPTLDLIKKLDSEFQLDRSKNVILLLGPSHSGCTTLKLLLSGASLMLKETSPNSGQFLFFDSNNKIGQSSFDSHTIIPEPVFDPELNATYYDFSAFEDSRPGFELPSAYLLRKLLMNAKFIKIVLVINKSSVLKGEERKNFNQFVEYVIMLLKNIDRYQNSIAMVATKADNTLSFEDDFLNNDLTLIQDVRNFLFEEKSRVQETLSNLNLTSNDRKFNIEKFKLLKILLIQTQNRPKVSTRIRIFRRAMEEGPLKNMTEIMKNKKDIKNMIEEILKYYKNDRKVDIGYVVSSRAVDKADSLIDETVENQLNKNIWDACNQMKNNPRQIFDNVIRDKVKYVQFLLNIRCKSLPVKVIQKPIPPINDTEVASMHVSSQNEDDNESSITRLLDTKIPDSITSVLNAFEKFYFHVEGTTENIQQLRDMYHDGYEILNEVSVKDPRTLLAAVNKSEIRLSNDIYMEINNVINNFTLYKSMVNKNSPLLEKSDAILRKTKNQFKNAYTWYDSLIGIYSDLCSVNCENKNEIVNRLIKTAESAEDVNDVGFEKLEYCTNKGYNIFRVLGTLKLDSNKRNALKKVLLNSLKSPTITCSRDKLNMNVTGNIVRMSAVVADKNCWNYATLVIIFARDSVFIDSDLSKFGSINELVIMAPVWSISGKRKFSFKGNDGLLKGTAKHGVASHERPGHGEHGEVGNPGEPGGSFFGIGDIFVNGADLTIESKGGHGGAGQNGGNGANGMNAMKPYIKVSSDKYLYDCLDMTYAAIPMALANVLAYKELKRELEWRCMETYLRLENFPTIDRSFWKRKDKMVSKRGVPGTAGGDGGRGGEGGDGGKYGHIDIYELSQSSHFVVENIDGERGAMGLKGKGGRGAERSYIMDLKIVDSWWVGIPGVCLKWSTKVYADAFEPITRSGNDGTDGTNNKNRRYPAPAAHLYDPRIMIDEFKSFMQETSKNTFREADVNSFLLRLENDPGIRQMYK